jgi:diaminohydroxyphosphoribosylaminopyrimidine deaminase/5-amino-6-(5-phosphoribosylamino)uracil reductase
VNRVIAAMHDPNPKVSGAGMRRLADAGIAAETGLLEDSARALNPGFCRRMRTGRPWLRSKLAVSLDGRTALASGDSRWITGPEARRDVHRLRARSSAIVTGIGTVLADDPELTVRLDNELSEFVPPVRVVLDSGLRTPPTARLCSGERSVILTTRKALAEVPDFPSSVRVCPLPADGRERIELAAAVEWLGASEFNEILVEAGPALNGALLQAGLVDEWVVYVAPVVLGSGAREMFSTAPLTAMAERSELTLSDARQVGRDLRLTFRRASV